MEKILIDANALKNAMYSIQPIPDSEYIFIDVIIEEIDNAHTVDAVEAVHGRWVVYESDETYGPYDSKEWYKCSECGKDAYGRCYDDEWYSSPILSDYCPNCGAKMDGGNEDV